MPKQNALRRVSWPGRNAASDLSRIVFFTYNCQVLLSLKKGRARKYKAVYNRDEEELMWSKLRKIDMDRETIELGFCEVNERALNQKRKWA